MTADDFPALLRHRPPFGSRPVLALAGGDEVRRELRAYFDDLEDRLRTDTGAAPGTAESEQTRAAVTLLRAAILGTLAAVQSTVVYEPRTEPREDDSHNLLGKVGRSLLGERPRERVPAERVAAPARVEMSLLREQLEGVFDAALRLLEAAEPPPPQEVARPWARDPELVDTLHDLLTAGHLRDGEMALHYIEALRRNLKLRHDIAVTAHDGTNDALFKLYQGGPYQGDGEPSGQTRTLRPALVSRGERLRYGEARVPSAPSADPPGPPPDGSGPATGEATGSHDRGPSRGEPHRNPADLPPEGGTEDRREEGYR